MSVVVDTKHGAVEGAVEDGVAIFYGIPYAQPPLGALRFAPPRESLAWSGVRDGRQAGPASLQVASAKDIGPAGSDEDCLYLNVWAPAEPCDASLPVYVWFPGGSFVGGSATEKQFSGERLAREQGIVVVTANYRLGMLGCVSWDDEGRPQGNNFLRDMLAALRWVRENIAAFGGDAERVTVGGNSAGAIAVADLLACDDARGLFRSAILQSGNRALTQSRTFSEDVHTATIRELGVDRDDPRWLGHLAQIPAGDILGAQARVAQQFRSPWGPVADGNLLAGTVDELVASAVVDVPVLIGTNTDENSWFFSAGLSRQRGNRSMEDAIAACFDVPPDADEIRALAARYEHFLSKDDAWVAFLTDWEWRLPAHRMASDLASRGVQTFMYEFTWRLGGAEGHLGATHGLETAFPFGTLAAATNRFASDPHRAGERESLSSLMLEAWARFIRDSRPAAEGIPEWKPYTKNERWTMLLGAPMELACGRFAERLDGLGGVVKKLKPLVRDY